MCYTVVRKLALKAIPGRIVLYVLSSDDVSIINFSRARAAKTNSIDPVRMGNPIRKGDVVSAMIVRAWDDTLVNLQVFLDGNDVEWVTSRKCGIGPGTWRWPEIGG